MDHRQECLRRWIAQNFNPLTRLQVNQYIPDFMLRRLFERSDGGFQVDQNEFVDAMDAIGFLRRQTRNRDWVFNISEAEYRKVLGRHK